MALGDQSKVDCGNLLPNWIAAAIKSRLWELIAKLDSSCSQRFPNWIAAAINPQTPPPCQELSSTNASGFAMIRTGW